MRNKLLFNVVQFITLIIIIGLLSACDGKDGACIDYVTAGEKMYEQISKYDSRVYVSYNSDHYNRFLGINDDISNIMKEAFKNNGNPQEGDHLALNAEYTEGEYVPVELKDGTYNLNMTFNMSYITTKEQEKELKDKADAILTKLDVDEASEYEKVRAIYNYICSNVTYDEEHLNDDSYRLKCVAYAAAVNGTAVCSGIADLFYYLATSAGLEARITMNDTHAWNIVKVEGEYYYLDATWDLGLNESDYRYFLKGSEDFFSILNGPEYLAHRTYLVLFDLRHPLENIQLEYEISQNAYSA